MSESRKTEKRLTWVAGDRPIDQLDDVSRKILAADNTNGTSIFDPVLCEILYRWFCPSGGLVLDPFAGGSVRGLVAGILGRRYHGIELRLEQVLANQEQRSIAPESADIAWVHGDSLERLPTAPDADMIIGCPPYADLEVYSDNPADLSAMSHADFMVAHAKIIGIACAKLKDDRFAAWVIGDVRDKRGMYLGLVGETVTAFKAAGLELYNDAILLTAVGSLPVRSGRMFSASRKMGKTHQNVLVFVKGDPSKAAQAIGEVDVSEEEPISVP